MNERPITDWNYLSTENEFCLPQNYGNIEMHECFLKGKHSPEANEDGIFVSDSFIAVIDGATAKSDFRPEGKTTGRMAMELLKDVLDSLPADAGMTEAVQAVTRRFHDFYVANGWLHTVEDIPSRRLTACAVIYSHARREVWQVGDCQCRMGKIYSANAKAVDGIMAAARAAFNEVALLNGETAETVARHDPGRAFIMPFLERQSRLQNNGQVPAPYGFAVFDGFEVLLRQVKVFQVAEGMEVILASDGYPRLGTTLKKSERYLHYILQHDPNCMRIYKSTKGLQCGNVSFDDRAYVRFTVGKKE